MISKIMTTSERATILCNLDSLKTAYNVLIACKNKKKSLTNINEIDKNNIVDK